MFTPLMLTGIGELIVILLILAFVTAMFCLMLIGLGILIAFPLTLIRPLFGKRFKWDKELFLASLLFTPIVFLLGMFGIELAKIFGDGILEMFKISPIFRCLCLFFVAFVMSIIVSLLTTHKLRKSIDDLDMKALEAKRNFQFSLMDECQAKCAPLKKRAELIYVLCAGVSCLIIALIAVFMDWL